MKSTCMMILHLLHVPGLRRFGSHRREPSQPGPGEGVAVERRPPRAGGDPGGQAAARERVPRDRVLRRHPRLRRPRRVRSNVLSSGAIDYGVPSGRRDGLTSAASDDSRSLPPPFARLDRLTELFAAKGFTQDELVTLSGAHSVGRAHCASFSHRIHIHPTVSETMDAQYGAGLQQRCPTDAGDAVDQDQATPADLDNQYYRNLLAGKVLFRSDWALISDNTTSQMVPDNAGNQAQWAAKFVDAMRKMGALDVVTDSPATCRAK
jgi:peroxidase